MFNKICVVGLGYIGLPTAAILASHGLAVTGVDINPKTVETINHGKIHIVEPDLEVLVRRVVKTNFLRAVLKPEKADVFLITVPTPLQNKQYPDLSYLNAAVESIAPHLCKGNLIILESTSPVGTTEALSNQLSILRNDLVFPHQKSKCCDIFIAYCPERVMPGQIISELIHNDRIIGGITPKCATLAQQLYQIFIKGKCLITTTRTAEMVKLTENAFRDVNIAFANELSIICDKQQIDVWELIQLANHHPRVNILQPGPGVGGHCIAVDPWFIVQSNPDEAKLMRTAREVNDNKPFYVLDKIHKIIASVDNPIIAYLGLAYKANTDDLRESPAIRILQELSDTNKQCMINIVEPHIDNLPDNLADYSNFALTSLTHAIASSNIIIIMVAHNEFKWLHLENFKEKHVMDIVNLSRLSTLLGNDHKKKPHHQISEFGMMMANRIYGNIIT